MGFVDSWKGVVLKPPEAFEGLKGQASVNASVPHYAVSFVPNVFGIVFALLLGAGFSINSLLGLVYAVLSLVIFVAVSYEIAKALGGTGSLEQHVYCQSVSSAAFGLISFFMLVVVVGLAFALFASLAAPLASALSSGDMTAVVTYVTKNLGEVIGKAIIVGIVFLVLMLAAIVLMSRTYYNQIKSVHGFGAGKFILFLVCLAVVQSIIQWIINTLFRIKPV